MIGHVKRYSVCSAERISSVSDYAPGKKTLQSKQSHAEASFLITVIPRMKPPIAGDAVELCFENHWFVLD
jgi:hypothetical protein